MKAHICHLKKRAKKGEAADHSGTNRNQWQFGDQNKFEKMKAYFADPYFVDIEYL